MLDHQVEAPLRELEEKLLNLLVGDCGAGAGGVRHDGRQCHYALLWARVAAGTLRGCLLEYCIDASGDAGRVRVDQGG